MVEIPNILLLLNSPWWYYNKSNTSDDDDDVIMTRYWLPAKKIKVTGADISPSGSTLALTNKQTAWTFSKYPS